MKVLFVQESALDESQALFDLAALLESRGHAVTMLLDREETALPAVAQQLRPDLALVTCSMLNHGWAREIAGRVRAATGAPVLLGGTAPTLFPDGLRGIAADALVRGEAEGPVLSVLDMLGRGGRLRDCDGAPGLAFETDAGFTGTDPVAPFDLSALPLASKDPLYGRYPFLRAFPFKRFLASRGCHHRCTYCYMPSLNKLQPKWEGQRVRRKPPEHAVAEVAREKAQGPLHHVHFSDDLFTNDADWLRSFASLYRREVGIPFTCNTSAELIDDDVAESLAEAGCFAIGFAVETATARLRQKVLRKGVTTDHFHRAAAALRKKGIQIGTFNMVALPGETPDEVIDTALLNAELRSDFCRLNYAFPMPGTGMHDYAVTEGHLDADWTRRFWSPAFRYQQGPQFSTPYEREFRNLFVMFRPLARDRRLLPAVRRLVRAPTLGPLHRALTLQNAWSEKQQFRIPVVAGLKFFAKVGRPELRSTNFPALI